MDVLRNHEGPFMLPETINIKVIHNAVRDMPTAAIWVPTLDRESAYYVLKVNSDGRPNESDRPIVLEDSGDSKGPIQNVPDTWLRLIDEVSTTRRQLARDLSEAQ